MSNKYGSIVRTYTVRNMYEDTLSPGTDITVPHTSPTRSVPFFPLHANKETNFSVKRVGVFSNFADGLVFANPENRLSVFMRFFAYTLAESYEVQLTYGNKAVTTIGTPNWTPGSDLVISIEGIHRRINPTAAGTGNLLDYWDGGSNTFDARNLATPSGGATYTAMAISTLNCMYDVVELAEPFSFGFGIDYDTIDMEVALNVVPGGVGTTDFLTNIIDASFTGESVYFDVVTEVEFTGADA